MNNKDNDIMFIAWESHRRTIELCKYFGIKLIIMSSSKSRLLKHPVFAIRTIYMLFKYKPKCLIIQNPSIVLALVGCIFKRAIGYYFIVDAHNAAIIPETKILKYIKRLHFYIFKKTDITIVTNKILANIVISMNGKPYVLPDKLPSVEVKIDKHMSSEYFNIACISTFNLDEPYKVIISAARLMPHVNLYMTGNYNKLPESIIDNKPSNVIFTGFLSDENYWKLLCSVNLVIDLTTRDNCLVCGAYEAVSVGKPVILSDTKALRNYFNKGVIFTKNDSIELVDNINYAISHIEDLNKSINELRHEMDAKWNGYSENILNILKGIRT